MQHFYSPSTFIKAISLDIELKVHRLTPNEIHCIGILLLALVRLHAAADIAVVQWCDVMKTSSDLSLKS